MNNKIYPTRETAEGRIQVRTADGRWLDAVEFGEMLDQWPSIAKKDMSHDGVPVLTNATYKSPGCECGVVGNGTLQFPLTIEFCRKHAAGEIIADMIEQIAKPKGQEEL